MSTKFADFLAENKIDPRRLLSISEKLEKLRPEDRHIILAKRNKPEDAPGKKPAEETTDAPKRRSGRPATPRVLAAATSGGKVPGPAKTRLLRAVNHILEQRKKAAVDLRALF